ncbi:hypothetical protein IE53DRAFT_384803 [Violaceomyces palustris]|uniref:Uncharacterized protein n=1 Tax=Violaceomyces palustris TaxID=1673888 RepID=A0ACD0P3X0_9BASI|nr:hypothetical protein IE53DRAFT_384803 [Violaceomyces palustris]
MNHSPPTLCFRWSLDEAATPPQSQTHALTLRPANGPITFTRTLVKNPSPNDINNELDPVKSFDSKVMSRNHAKIEWLSHRRIVVLVDLDSTHGTWISRKGSHKDAKLVKMSPNTPYEIKEGDLVHFGREVIKGGVIHKAVKGYMSFKDIPTAAPEAKSRYGLSDSDVMAGVADEGSVAESCDSVEWIGPILNLNDLRGKEVNVEERDEKVESPTASQSRSCSPKLEESSFREDGREEGEYQVEEPEDLIEEVASDEDENSCCRCIGTDDGIDETSSDDVGKDEICNGDIFNNEVCDREDDFDEIREHEGRGDEDSGVDLTCSNEDSKVEIATRSASPAPSCTGSTPPWKKGSDESLARVSRLFEEEREEAAMSVAEQPNGAAEDGLERQRQETTTKNAIDCVIDESEPGGPQHAVEQDADEETRADPEVPSIPLLEDDGERSSTCRVKRSLEETDAEPAPHNPVSDASTSPNTMPPSSSSERTSAPSEPSSPARKRQKTYEPTPWKTYAALLATGAIAGSVTTFIGLASLATGDLA